MMLTWDGRYQALQAIGFMSIYLEKPFDWRVHHENVLILDGEDELVPQGRDTNPYGAVDDHWRQLTAASPVLVINRGSKRTLVRWNGTGWVEVEPTERAA